jgi:hypothetical protein
LGDARGTNEEWTDSDPIAKGVEVSEDRAVTGGIRAIDCTKGDAQSSSSHELERI